MCARVLSVWTGAGPTGQVDPAAPQAVGDCPDGALLTTYADCCHSGTLLDQPVVQISGPKSGDPSPPPQLVDTFTASLERDVCADEDVSNRCCCCCCC